MKQDRPRAVSLYRRSARQGNARAQLNLGLCYRDGTGIRKKKRMALKWLGRAAENGEAEAMEIIEELSRITTAP